MGKISKGYRLVWVLLLMGRPAAHAQEQWVLRSDRLPAPDTVAVYRPHAFQPDQRYALLYLLHGYSESWRQWGRTTDCQRLADELQAVVVIPDGFQTWYLNSPADAHSRYEDFFFKELVPYVHRHVHVDSANVFISGLSMGGYGALRYFLLHPGYFTAAAATSGAFEVNATVLDAASRHFFHSSRIANDLTHALGSPAGWDQYSIARLLPTAPRRPFLLDCGREDILLPVTKRVAEQAIRLGYPITYTLQPGDHNTAYWKYSIQQHLLYFKAHRRPTP